jgi:serine/threonine protein phosphatase 1
MPSASRPAADPVGRVIAVGDIHGCLAQFDAILSAVGLREGDTLVTLGDYVDRGPDSCGVLFRLVKLHEAGRLVALLGNHDKMMLDARGGDEAALDVWLGSGGGSTLESYAPAPGVRGRLADVPDDHWEFLARRCVLFHETPTHFFVHANAYPDIPLDEQPEYMLLWERFRPEKSRPHESGKVMVCGHTSQHEMVPLVLPHAICLDTWAHAGGLLTACDVTDGTIWQADPRGRVSRKHLSDFDAG